MKTRIVLFILFISGVFGLSSFFALLEYFDPYVNIVLGLTLLIMSYCIATISFGTIIFYSIKKIYFRGAVGIYHIFSSIRQVFWISLFPIFYIILLKFQIPFVLPMILIGVLLFLLELFIKTLR